MKLTKSFVEDVYLTFFNNMQHIQIICHIVYFSISLNDFTLLLNNTENKTRLNFELISKSFTVAKY